MSYRFSRKFELNKPDWKKVFQIEFFVHCVHLHVNICVGSGFRLWLPGWAEWQLNAQIQMLCCLVLIVNERNRSNMVEQTHTRRISANTHTSACTEYDATSFFPKTWCTSLCVQIGNSRLLLHMTIQSPCLSHTHAHQHTHAQVAVISVWSPFMAWDQTEVPLSFSNDRVLLTCAHTYLHTLHELFLQFTSFLLYCNARMQKVPPLAVFV